MPEQKSTSHRRPVRSSEQDQLAQVGRLQPQAVELERAVIGACLIEQDAFATVSDFLKPQSFYESKHQVIFQAIQSLAASNSPIDLLTVTNRTDITLIRRRIPCGCILTEVIPMNFLKRLSAQRAKK